MFTGPTQMTIPNHIMSKMFVKDHMSIEGVVEHLLSKDDEGGRGSKPKDDNC